MSTPNFPMYLSVKEVASILTVNKSFVYRHEEEIPGFVKIAGKSFFDADILFKELKRSSKEVRSFPQKLNTPME